MRRTLIAVLFAVLLAAGLAACGDSDESSSAGSTSASSREPIVLGFAIGTTGFMSAYDGPPQIAARMAMDDINAEGGVGGRRLEMVTADMKSEADLSGDAATQVLQDGAEVVVTSCDFDLGSPAAIVAQNAGKLALSTCAASAAFGPTGIGPLAFTMATAVNAEAAAMAQYGIEDKGYRSAYVLLDNSLEFTKQSAYAFTERWKALGGTIAGQDTFKQGDRSIGTQITRLKGLATPPDVIYLVSYMPGEAEVLKQLRAAGVEVPIFTDEGVDGDFWKGAVPDIGGIEYATYVSIYGDDPDQQVNDLVDRYTREAGRRPDNGLFITGYALVQAVAKAVEGADGSLEGAKLAEQMDAFSAAPFVLPTTFTKDLHITLDRTQRIMRIEGGRTSFVKQLRPSEVPMQPVKK